MSYANSTVSGRSPLTSETGDKLGFEFRIDVIQGLVRSIVEPPQVGGKTPTVIQLERVRPPHLCYSWQASEGPIPLMFRDLSRPSTQSHEHAWRATSARV
jgi:hypothetical protein